MIPSVMRLICKISTVVGLLPQSHNARSYNVIDPNVFAFVSREGNRAYALPLCLEMQHLNLPHRNHLFPQVILILANGAVPSSDCLVLADHDVLGDLVE